ncbi:MAG: SurA N-terminal domain-containing protein [Burkholderiaceae bacterium]
MGQFARSLTLGGAALILSVVALAQPVAPSSSSAQVTPLGGGAQIRPLAPPAPSQGLRAPSSPTLIDRVVAIVNREVITASELARREKQFVVNLKRQGVTAPPPAVLREQVLDRMINDRAMLQLARETGIRVDDLTLDRSVARIAEQNGLSVSGLRNQLEREGISFSSFRQDIREEIILTRLREREVDNRLQISDSEVDTFLAAQGQSIQRI